jgi:hypothetical protein
VFKVVCRVCTSLGMECYYQRFRNRKQSAVDWSCLVLRSKAVFRLLISLQTVPFKKVA